MANKLPWFTHDHNARNDDFIHRAEDRFGPFGYSAWFKLIEVLHEHGVGDILKITKSRLCSELRCTWPRLELYLNYSQTMNKVTYNCSSGEVELQIKKFRERQSKMKPNLPSILPQSSLNPPLHREGHIQKQRQEQTNSTFHVFWNSWPEKKDRADSEKAWNKLNPDPSLVSVILKAIIEQEKFRSYCAEKNKFYPQRKSPAAWLRSKRWEDVVGEVNEEYKNPNEETLKFLKERGE